MSRIGKKPVIIPANCTVDIAEGNAVTVKGPKGTLSYTFHPDMILKVEGNVLTVERPDDAESEGGVCVLHLIADDPELFAGLDGAKISRVNSANRSFMQPWREYTMNDRVQWSIAAIPSAPWAKKMFPELDTAAAIEAQWKLIFDTCRVTGGDPVNEWKAHLGRLTSLGEKMNALDLESVHFESANGIGGYFRITN